MIEITWEKAILLYLLVILAFLLLLWLHNHFQKKKNKISLTTKIIFICEYCASAYIDEAPKKITRCPACKSMNKRL